MYYLRFQKAALLDCGFVFSSWATAGRRRMKHTESCGIPCNACVCCTSRTAPRSYHRTDRTLYPLQTSCGSFSDVQAHLCLLPLSGNSSCPAVHRRIRNPHLPIIGHRRICASLRFRRDQCDFLTAITCQRAPRLLMSPVRHDCRGTLSSGNSVRRG